MTTLQKQVQQAMSHLPKNATLDDLMYRLYVLDRIEKAEIESDRGEVVDIDTLRKEVEKW